MFSIHISKDLRSFLLPDFFTYILVDPKFISRNPTKNQPECAKKKCVRDTFCSNLNVHQEEQVK